MKPTTKEEVLEWNRKQEAIGNDESKIEDDTSELKDYAIKVMKTLESSDLSAFMVLQVLHEEVAHMIHEKYVAKAEQEARDQEDLELGRWYREYGSKICECCQSFLSKGGTGCYVDFHGSPCPEMPHCCNFHIPIALTESEEAAAKNEGVPHETQLNQGPWPDV